MLDERALFVGQWGLKGNRGEYEAMVEEEGRPRLRALINEVQSRAGSMPLLYTVTSLVTAKGMI
jgi:cobalamin-dependent methionine synthase I